ncbi:DUF4747 family protein [Microvirga ossetica]|uniref:DUF4747 family protein n=1 Tax=Microvirga ossetica TaxID=1882682 RepID=UPI000C152DA1|nr:DUF4747 family protein [Microvirga ossetica]
MTTGNQRNPLCARAWVITYLRPNFVPFLFFFDSQKHQLFFEIKGPDGSIAPTEVERFFAILLTQRELFEKYGPVYVNLVSRRESIDKILSGLDLKKLAIRIQRPNPDDHQDLDRRMRDRLRRQRASSLTETLQAAPGETFDPDEDTLALAKVATINGEVSATGRDENGASVTRSTRSYPAIETVSYDPDVISNNQAFITSIRNF